MPQSFRRFFGRTASATVASSVLLALLIFSTPVRAWQQTGAATATARPAVAAALTAAEREAVARVRAETVREMTTTLSSNEMQGRGTAQPGADRAARHIADQFAKLGLKPRGDAGTYLQAIRFKSAQVMPESYVRAGDVTLKAGEDFVVAPPFTFEQADVSGGLVFAGFGVASPELKRDDLAGLDIKGKIVVLLSVQTRPNNVEQAAWSKATSPTAIFGNLFGRGAVGVIFANVGTKEQPYSVIANYLSRRRVSLATEAEPPFKLPPFVLVSNPAMEKLFAGAGSTFAQTLDKAMTGEFVSRDLGKTTAISLRIKKEEGTSSNVVGVLEGSDPKLKEEAVVYSAHYDAYGIGADGRIYPGAADNALGVGMITAIAEGFARTPARPRRSIIFLAVTGEEYGLLGAEHWVRNSTWPIERVAANLNFDGIGTEIYGPVKRIVGWGQEHSSLGTLFEAVVPATGNVVTPDPMPEEKAFYRSDHYAFVKRGVPALMLLGAPEGDTAVWIARARKWLETDYHSPSDTVRPDWNWSGPQTLASIGLVMGMRVANADAMPTWLATSPFNRPRGTNEPPPAQQ